MTSTLKRFSQLTPLFSRPSILGAVAVACIASLAVPHVAMADDDAQGYWEYEYFKHGQIDMTGVMNFYSDFPTEYSQSPTDYHARWYESPGGSEGPMNGSVGLAEDHDGFTDMAGSFFNQGAMAYNLIWNPGPNNAPAPKKLYFLETLESYGDILGSRQDAPAGTPLVHNPTTSVRAKFPQMAPGAIRGFEQMTTGGVGTGAVRPEFAFDNYMAIQHSSRLIVINNTAQNTRIRIPSTFAGTQSSWYMVPGESSGSESRTSVSRNLTLLNPTVSVRRHNSGQEFGSEAIVAAGGADSDEHKFDVRVSFNPANGSIPVGLSFASIPIIVSGEGVQTNAKFIPAENPLTEPGGNIVIGQISSSDKQRLNLPLADRRLRVQIDMGLGKFNPQASIIQKWDTGDEWEMAPYLIGSESNSFVRFKPKFDGVPITGHIVKFQITKVRLTIWLGGNQSVKKIITTDPAEVDEDATVPILLGNPTDYLKFEDEVATEDSPGVYKGKLKLDEKDNVTVEQVWFKAVDQGVYVKTAQ